MSARTWRGTYQTHTPVLADALRLAKQLALRDHPGATGLMTPEVKRTIRGYEVMVIGRHASA